MTADEWRYSLPDLLTPTEIATKLTDNVAPVSRFTILRRINEKVLPAKQLSNGQFVVERDDFLRLVDEIKVGTRFNAEPDVSSPSLDGAPASDEAAA